LRSTREETPTAKRLKVVEETEQSDNDSLQKVFDEDADASDLGFDEPHVLDVDDDGITARPVIEDALPPLKTDKEAIEEYEAMRASQTSVAYDAASRIDQRMWVKGRSSIYVDAFNLALETVLEDESHLFDEKELAVFDQWKQLDYETQFL
jgi:fanconi-associated nuclease 1